MKLLALDIATHCGWAVSDKIYGVWDLTPKRDESSGMRLVRFKAKLLEIIGLEHIDTLVFERPAGFHKGAIIVQSELQGITKEYCEKSNINYRAYSSKEIKKFATGNGNANKEKMIKAAKEKLGYTGNNDNEADAIWLLKLAESDLSVSKQTEMEEKIKVKPEIKNEKSKVKQRS